MQSDSKKYNSKGSVSVQSVQGRLRLQLPRHIYDGKQKYLTLGLDDTPGNRQIAEAKAKEIERDIQLNVLVPGSFDSSLNKYRPESFRLIESSNTSIPTKSLWEIWDKFISYKNSISSPSTVKNQNATYTKYVKRLPTHDLGKAIEIRDWVIANIPPDSAKRFIIRLNACCNWAIDSKLIAENPFVGMASKMTIPTSQSNSDEINPFSIEERNLIINAFRNDIFTPKYANTKHSYYADYVEFLFLTGCRPSEAIGLQRKHIEGDFQCIRFDTAVVTSINGLVRKDGLKTQERRKFPINLTLRTLLERVCKDKKPDDLLFPSPRGKYLDSDNFRKRTWKPVLDGLGIQYRKPYQTRHTFITLALDHGLDAKDVAKLVGNSPEIIYNHYAGNKRNLFVPEF